MPLLRTETGCRCKNTLVSITTTRLRRSRGAGWRKMLFQTCELRMKSPMAIWVRGQGSRLQWLSQQNVRIRIVPLPQLALEFAGFVYHQLAVVATPDGVAFEWTGGGAFKVHAADLEAA